MFPNISVPQALDVYDDLVKAYHGENGYGGNVAEIYCYRLLPANPSAEAAIRAGVQYDEHPNKKGFLWPALMEAGRMAADNLFAVIEHFQQKYPDAKIHFEDSIQDPNADEGVGKLVWRKPISYLRGGIHHRVHVRVLPKRLVPRMKTLEEMD